MNRIKTGKWEFTEQEIARQLRDAAKRGEEAQRTEARAERVYYDGNHRRLIIELVNGVLLGIPVSKIQGLANAAPGVIEDVRLEPSGDAVRWDALDLDFGIPGLVAGVLGTNAWMAELGRLGGSAQSEAKAAAARFNGLKGGRPAKASTIQVVLQGRKLTPPAEAVHHTRIIGATHVSAGLLAECGMGIIGTGVPWQSPTMASLMTAPIVGFAQSSFDPVRLYQTEVFTSETIVNIPPIKEATKIDELALAA